jgi:hypothetical protein
MLNYFWGKGPKGPEMGQEEQGKVDDKNSPSVSSTPAADPAEELKSAANEAFKGKTALCE